MTTEAVAVATTTAIAAIAVAVATTVDVAVAGKTQAALKKKRRIQRRFFVPEIQYSDKSANGCRPSQALWKCASTTASGTALMSGQCQCGF